MFKTLHVPLEILTLIGSILRLKYPNDLQQNKICLSGLSFFFKSITIFA